MVEVPIGRPRRLWRRPLPRGARLRGRRPAPIGSPAWFAAPPQHLPGRPAPGHHHDRIRRLSRMAGGCARRLPRHGRLPDGRRRVLADATAVPARRPRHVLDAARCRRSQLLSQGGPMVWRDSLVPSWARKLQLPTRRGCRLAVLADFKMRHYPKPKRCDLNAGKMIRCGKHPACPLPLTLRHAGVLPRKPRRCSQAPAGLRHWHGGRSRP
jgi:hypothetical protein